MPSYFYHILLELLIAGGGNNNNNNNNNSTPTLATDEHGPVAIQYENDNPDTFSPFSPSSSHPHPHRHPSQLRLLLDGSDKNDIDITLRGFCDALQPFRNGHKRRARGSAGKGARGGDDWDCHNNQNNRNSNRHLRRKNFRGGNSNGNSGGGEIDRDLVGGGVHETLANTASKTQPITPTSRLANDKRFDQISIECIDMVVPEQNQNQKQSQTRSQQQTATTTTHQPQQPQQPATKGNNNSSSNNNNNPIAKGIGTNVIGGLATKGRYVPLDQKVSDSAWGIVHLYRDAVETSTLYRDDDDPSFLKGSALTRSAMLDSHSSNNVGRKYGLADDENAGSRGSGSSAVTDAAAHSTEDCSTLCILAVPSYMSPSDFLGFVGDQTRDEVSHFRMIRTARANRYMVLMKFRSGKKAKEWQRAWNGKVFNSMEPETCHVVFVKTVEIQVEAPGTESKFPDMNNDPFTPATTNQGLVSSASPPPQSSTLSSTSLSTKPLAPPTPSLIELPTCPVCLERMDETTGLLTIICQHVFHCTCLQKWKGSGCPVCRYTQEEFGKRAAHAFDFDQGPAECRVCHSEVNLWLCLICGNIGCGRYDEAHAFAHFKDTSHAFAMDLASQRVWDYVGDGYVHRIIQNKSDGKLVELPAAGESALDPPDWADAVPREKLENMSVEYTHLLTSQLESQRTYFEEVVERAADKASVANAAATAAQEAAETATKNLAAIQAQYDTLLKETIPNLERDKGRAERRAEKFETMAHRMEKEWREEKALNGSLLEKVEFLNGEVQKLTVANEDLREQNRDLSFFISGAERLRDQGEDVVEGTVSVPEPEEGAGAGGRRKKGKGKGRK
ncbi:RING-10 protein [Histoplasma capsulatum H143]|uniref:RING-10 protein n=1 Tax=Ajellomyces capsulatus (strain H143) TaxID=544712 RepID=C6H2M0_AJECH|nr:RING-10 protein [Histoplasma capsulatum H143]